MTRHSPSLGAEQGLVQLREDANLDGYPHIRPALHCGQDSTNQASVRQGPATVHGVFFAECSKKQVQPKNAISIEVRGEGKLATAAVVG